MTKSHLAIDQARVKLDKRYDAAVLVSLNTAVDKGVKSLYPLVHKQTGTPYMFIDNTKQFADPVTLFRVVVNFILFMIKHVEDDKDPNAMGQKVSNAITQAKEMEVSCANG